MSFSCVCVAGLHKKKTLGIVAATQVGLAQRVMKSNTYNNHEKKMKKLFDVVSVQFYKENLLN